MTLILSMILIYALDLPWWLYPIAVVTWLARSYVMWQNWNEVHELVRQTRNKLSRLEKKTSY